jgi:hypothetical protein
MGYDEGRNSGASGDAIVIAGVLVVFLLVLGLLAVGVGAVFFVRTRAVEQQAIVARERAVVEAERARRVQAEAQRARDLSSTKRDGAGALEGETQGDPKGSDTIGFRQLTIQIGEDGDIQADGDALDLGSLKEKLRALRGDEDTTLKIVIQVDHRCVFQHVAAVLSVCDETGINNVRVAASEDSQAGAIAPAIQPDR